MADTCLICRLLVCPPGELWDLGRDCPRSMRFLNEDAVIKLAAERDCLAAGIAVRDRHLKALTERAKRNLERVLEEIDLVIEETEDAPCTGLTISGGSLELANARETASESDSAAVHAGNGGRETFSRSRKRAPVVGRTNAAPAGTCEGPRQLSCGWSLESFDHGFRVGRQLSRDGMCLVLTVDSEAPAQALLPEAAVVELLKESGVMLG